MSETMNDLYLVAIVALLPITAGMLIVQHNPYHALIIRGILGAAAALIYALFGAADVALTEALVGTMLSITLYAVAVRSSLNLRVGILADSDQTESLKQQLQSQLQPLTKRHHLRLEFVTFEHLHDLQTALKDKQIHISAEQTQLQTRVPRLYELLRATTDIRQTNVQPTDIQPSETT